MSTPTLGDDEIASASREVSRHTGFLVVWIVGVILAVLAAAVSVPRGLATLDIGADQNLGVILIVAGSLSFGLAIIFGYRAGVCLSKRSRARRRLDRAVAVAADLAV